MNARDNEAILAIVKKLFQNKTPQEKATLLVGIINDLFNMHPPERDGSFYSEEWAKQILVLVKALGFLIKQNSNNNSELINYENTLKEIEIQHKDLLTNIEKSKVDLEQATKNVDDIIDHNRSLEENLQICLAIDKISDAIRELPVIKERAIECSIVASIDSNIDHIIKDAKVLHGEISEKLDRLELAIRKFVNSSEDEIKSLKKEVGR